MGSKLCINTLTILCEIWGLVSSAHAEEPPGTCQVTHEKYENKFQMGVGRLNATYSRLGVRLSKSIPLSCNRQVGRVKRRLCCARIDSWRKALLICNTA